MVGKQDAEEKREGGSGENSIMRNGLCARRPEGKCLLDNLELDGKLMLKFITNK
jgi:hypothetical protein